MASLVSRYLEYLILLVLALAAAAAVAILGRELDADMTAPAARAEERRASTVRTCQEVGLRPVSRREVTCRTKTSTLTFVNLGSVLSVGDLRLRVRTASTLPATTPSGRLRDRMRVTLDAELTNGRATSFDAAAEAEGLYLVSDARRVSPDERASRQPGSLELTTPLDPGETRSGEIRFELAGAATRAIERTGRAELGLRVAADRLGVVRLTFGG